jgi:hypothetical protein
MDKIIIIADKIMPNADLIGLIREHFPEQEIIILRRDEIGYDQAPGWRGPPPMEGVPPRPTVGEVV